MKKILLLVFAVLAVTPFGDAQVTPSAPIAFFVTPQALHKPFLNYIMAAKSSIFMEMYHLDDPDVVKALVSAAQGNNPAHTKIQISIILDGASFAGTNPNPQLVQAENQLKAAGIQVTHSAMLPGGFSITHVKNMVVDKQFAFITSINLTLQAASTRDYGVISRDPNVIAELLAIFAVDLKNAAADTRVTPPAALKLKNLVWSPVDSEAKLTNFILDTINIPVSANAAQNKRYLFATVENLGDCNIQAALKKAAAAGVDVRIIVPGCDENPCPLYNFPYLNDLANSGGKPAVKTHFMPKPAVPNAIQPYMHGKMMVAGNGTAYIGSINYSENSMLRARELGIIVQTGMYPGADQVIQGLVGTFTTDWGNSLDVSAGVPNNCPAEEAGSGCNAPTAPVCRPGAAHMSTIFD